MLGHIPHIHPVDGHPAAGGVIEPGNQVEQGGFAAAGGTNDGRGLAGQCRKADLLQGVIVGTGVAEADILKPDHTGPLFALQGLFGHFRRRVMDGGRGVQHLVDTVGGHARTGQHDCHHGQHQEGHDNLHGVGDEGNHLAHLHGPHIHGLAAEPDDEQTGAVHDQRHERHHTGHSAVGEQLGLHQFPVGHIKPLFLKLLAAEGAYWHDTGEDFPADQVEPVHQRLHEFELGHGNLHQYTDENQQRRHRQEGNPGQAGVAAGHMDDAADAQNGRVSHHPQQDDADKLHLLDVIGGTGDEGCGGELFNLGMGEANHRREGLPTQIPADGRRHPRGQEAHRDGHRNHDQRQTQHPTALLPEIIHLHLVGNALGLIFQ